MASNASSAHVTVLFWQSGVGFESRYKHFEPRATMNGSSSSSSRTSSRTVHTAASLASKRTKRDSLIAELERGKHALLHPTPCTLTRRNTRRPTTCPREAPTTRTGIHVTHGTRFPRATAPRRTGRQDGAREQAPPKGGLHRAARGRQALPSRKRTG